MIEIKLKSDNSTVAIYAYDFIGRRISTAVGADETNFVYYRWNPIAEFTGTALSKSYTWGLDVSGERQGAGGVGGLLSVNDGSEIYYPVYDGNGNVSEYVDSTGAVVAHYEYDAFGQVVASGVKKDDFAHQFSTKILDSESGLSYYGYRYYDSSNGRFLSRDPMEERGGANIFSFVKNNSINYWEFLGLSMQGMMFNAHGTSIPQNTSNKSFGEQLSDLGKGIVEAGKIGLEAIDKATDFVDEFSKNIPHVPTHKATDLKDQIDNAAGVGKIAGISTLKGRHADCIAEKGPGHEDCIKIADEIAKVARKCK